MPVSKKKQRAQAKREAAGAAQGSPLQQRVAAAARSQAPRAYPSAEELLADLMRKYSASDDLHTSQLAVANLQALEVRPSISLYFPVLGIHPRR